MEPCLFLNGQALSIEKLDLGSNKPEGNYWGKTCDHTNLMERDPYNCNGVNGNKACPLPKYFDERFF
jgi:hypothetical protein